MWNPGRKALKGSIRKKATGENPMVIYCGSSGETHSVPAGGTGAHSTKRGAGRGRQAYPPFWGPPSPLGIWRRDAKMVQQVVDKQEVVETESLAKGGETLGDALRHSFPGGAAPLRSQGLFPPEPQ